MNLEQFDRIIVEEEKVTVYLLNVYHNEGSSKAKFFLQQGFSPKRVKQFSDFLIKHCETYEATVITETIFGKKFIIEGNMIGPSQNEFEFRSVWIKVVRQNVLKFVTAYPI